MVITASGIPDQYDLFPAAPNDSVIVDELIDHLQDQLLLGDKGFIDDDTLVFKDKNSQNVTFEGIKRYNKKDLKHLIPQDVRDELRKTMDILKSKENE